MLKRLVCLSKPFLLGLSVLLASSPKKEIERQKDFGKGIEIAKEEGKPVLIHFWQPSCSQCQLMDREVWPNPEVVSQSEKFVSIPVNIQQSRRLLSKYKVRGTPVDVFADPWGNPIFRVLGGMSAEALVMMMKSFPADFSEVKKWQEILEEKSRNLEALKNAARYYRKLGLGIVGPRQGRQAVLCEELSNRYYERALKTKGARQDPEAREAILLAMGQNWLFVEKYKDARKIFEKCLKEVPNGSQRAAALMGLVTAQIGQGKMADAEGTFERLKSKYPDSRETRQAEWNLEEAKKN